MGQYTYLAEAFDGYTFEEILKGNAGPFIHEEIEVTVYPHGDPEADNYPVLDGDDDEDGVFYVQVILPWQSSLSDNDYANIVSLVAEDFPASAYVQAAR